MITAWIYNLYFHPLSKFPGPFLGRASLVSHLPRLFGENLSLNVSVAVAIYANLNWENSPLPCRIAPEIR